MGWIDVNDKLPPEGLKVLLEVSGLFSAPYGLVADHGFYIGCRIVPIVEDEDVWLIYDSCDEENYHIMSPTVHAWMPLPKHFQKSDPDDETDDGMEHAMFEDDPEWLYKGDNVYEQMSFEEFISLGKGVAV